MNARTLFLNIVIALALAALLATTSSCAKPVATAGDTVTVDYMGLFEDGTVFDTSIAKLALDAGTYDSGRNYAPLRVTVGSGQVIKGFENALVGMHAGENKTVAVPPELAYGKHSRGKVLNTRIVAFGSAIRITRPGNRSGLYSTSSYFRAMMLRSIFSLMSKVTVATTFSILYSALGPAASSSPSSPFSLSSLSSLFSSSPLASFAAFFPAI